MPKANSSRVAELKTQAHQQKVALGEMRIADVAQRSKSDRWVAQLVAHFDPAKMGVLWLSHRDGHYYIIDGQHRYYALIEWLDGDDWEVIEIEKCMVLTGLTIEDEADLFLDLNNSKLVQSYEKFQVALTAGRPIQTDIARIIRANGFTISQDRQSGIGATATLERIYDRDGGNDLGRMVRLLGNAYGVAGFESVVMNGIGQLCHRYNGQLEEDKAIKQLATMKGGVKGLLGAAYLLQEKFHQPLARCIAAAAVDQINRAPGRKLDKWWS